MSPLIPAFVVVLFLSAITGLALQWRFLSLLRTRHAQTWESLGRPSLFWNNSVANVCAVFQFLWRKDYLALGDPQFAKLAQVLRVYNVAYIILFLCVVIALFILPGTFRR